MYSNLNWAIIVYKKCSNDDYIKKKAQNDFIILIMYCLLFIYLKYFVWNRSTPIFEHIQYTKKQLLLWLSNVTNFVM